MTWNDREVNGKEQKGKGKEANKQGRLMDCEIKKKGIKILLKML